MKKVAINWDELSAAFDNSFPELSYYLDTETGEVILITEEAHQFVQELYEGEDDVDAPDFDLDAVLARSNMPLWQQENIRQAVFVEAYFGGRVIPLKVMKRCRILSSQSRTTVCIITCKTPYKAVALSAGFVMS